MSDELFVSYNHKGPLGNGVGFVVITYPKLIRSGQNIGEIVEIIKEYSRAELKQTLDSIVILSWRRMEV